jgi:hypothetical protein
LQLQGIEVDELELQGMEQPVAEQGMEEFDRIQEPPAEVDGIEDRMSQRQWHELISIKT